MKSTKTITLPVPQKAKPFRSASEERQVTGRYIALGTAIFLITLGLYHAWEHQIAVLAGLIVPALIMFLYILWILHTANKDAKRMRRLQVIRAQVNLIEVLTKPATNHEKLSPSSSSSKLSIKSKCSQHNCVLKTPSRSSSKSSLVTQKINVKPTQIQNTNVYYPEAIKSRLEKDKEIYATNIYNPKSIASPDQKDLKINQTQLENLNKNTDSNLPKYGTKRKRQTPLRVHLTQFPLPVKPGVLRTYSIA